MNYAVCTLQKTEQSSKLHAKKFCFKFLHQPTNSKFIIPPQRLKTRIIYFQQQQYESYPWLHYNINKNVLCFKCAKANSLNLVRSVKCSDPCFISTGFNKWKKATGEDGRFARHQESTCHKAAILALQNLQKPETVASLLSQQLSEKQHGARTCLNVLFTSTATEMSIS